MDRARAWARGANLESPRRDQRSADPVVGRRAISGGLRGLQYARTKVTHKNYKCNTTTCLSSSS